MLQLLAGGDCYNYWRQFDEAAGTPRDGPPYGRFYTEGNDELEPRDDYIEAFVEGVKDIWLLVADKI